MPKNRVLNWSQLGKISDNFLINRRESAIQERLDEAEAYYKKTGNYEKLAEIQKARKEAKLAEILQDIQEFSINNKTKPAIDLQFQHLVKDWKEGKINEATLNIKVEELKTKVIIYNKEEEQFLKGWAFHIEGTLGYLILFLLFTIFVLVRVLFGEKIKQAKDKGKSLIIENFKKSKQEYLPNLKTKFQNLDENKAVVMIIIIATIVAALLGYAFGETLYFYNDGSRATLKKHDYTEYNISYFAIIISFVLTAGLGYLLYKNEKK